MNCEKCGVEAVEGSTQGWVWSKETKQLFCPACRAEQKEKEIFEWARGDFDPPHKGRPPREVAMSNKANDRQVGGDHYKDMGVEPWDVVDTWPLEQRIGYYRGGALKYIMRMGSKDVSAIEIAKGKHYLEKLLEVLGEDDL